MPEQTASSASPRAVIDERQHAEETYRLIDNNEEFYQRTGSQLIAACKMQINVQVWASNFRSTLETVRRWADERDSAISQVLVEPRSDKVIFFVIPKSESYDFDLGFAQADLDVTLNTQCNIGYAETRQIPDWERSTFISDDARRVWPRSA